MDMLENDIKRPIQLLVLIFFASACGNINKSEAVDKTNLFVKTNRILIGREIDALAELDIQTIAIIVFLQFQIEIMY